MTEANIRLYAGYRFLTDMGVIMCKLNIALTSTEIVLQSGLFLEKKVFSVLIVWLIEFCFTMEMRLLRAADFEKSFLKEKNSFRLCNCDTLLISSVVIDSRLKILRKKDPGMEIWDRKEHGLPPSSRCSWILLKRSPRCLPTVSPPVGKAFRIRRRLLWRA